MIDRAVYARGEDGGITAIRRLDKAQTQRFAYDPQKRLVSEITGKSADKATQFYEYDTVGNRASLSGAKQKSYGYAPDANRLVRVGRKGLSYDPRGNLLADGNNSRTFAYDVTNRLAGYSKDGALRASYRYNAFGHA